MTLMKRLKILLKQLNMYYLNLKYIKLHEDNNIIDEFKKLKIDIIPYFITNRSFFFFILLLLEL